MDHTDHSASTHTMVCPVCSATIGVHAHDDEEAVGALVMAGKKHFEEAMHPMDAAMTEEAMEKMTRDEMKKVE